MLYHVKAFGVDFYVNHDDALRIQGYAALCEGTATLAEAISGDCFIARYLGEDID